MIVPRSLPEYRRFLEQELAEVEQFTGLRDIPQDVCEGFAVMVRNVGRLAIAMGLWRTAARCHQCRTSHLGVRSARQAILDALADLDHVSSDHASDHAPSDHAPQADFLTVQEAATRLRVSPRSVYDLVRSGRLHAQRVGNGRGAIRITPADLAQISQPTRRLRHL